MRKSFKIGAIILLTIFALILTIGAAFSQTTTWTPRFRENPRMLIADSALRIPVLPFDYAPYSNRDSVGRIWFNSLTGKYMAHYPGNIKKPFSSEDSSIKNQNIVTQIADFVISGNGAAAKLTTVGASVLNFNRYFVLSHGGIDTTQQRWAFGLQGVGGGGPTFVGDVLVFRSYTTAGAFLGDRLTLTRGGLLTVNSALVGTTPLSNLPGAVTGSLSVTNSVGVGVDLAVAQNLYTGGALAHNKTTTITSDYTVLGTDLFINVNNTANCIITIPSAAAANLSGRLLYIKKISNNAFTVTVVVSGGTQTIDGNASLVLSTANSTYLLHDDGANWYTYDRGTSSGTPTLDQVLTAGNTSTQSMTINNTSAFGLSLLVGATGTPSSTFQVNGSVQYLSRTITTSYTLTSTDYNIFCNNTSAITVTLPSASGIAGRVYVIYKINAATANVSIVPASGSGQLINNAASVTITSNLSSFEVKSDGTNWYVR